MLTPFTKAKAGAYFDGRTAARLDVAVTFTDEGIEIRGLPTGDTFWYHYEVRVADATSPSDPVRIERVTVGDAIVVDDPSLRQSLRLTVASPAAPSGARSWSLGKQIAVLAGAAAALVALLYVWVIPWAATRASAGVPLEWEEKLGEVMVTSLTRGERTCGEADRVAALQRMLGTLTADGRGGRYTYSITVVDDSMVNALAAPGGQIVFFHGLLAATETPEELAGVMAHEVQHIVLRHGTAGILRQIPMQLLVGALTGSGGVGEPAIAAAATLGRLGYARRDESEADAKGLEMLQASRASTDGMVSFMGRLATLNKAEPDAGLSTYLSTHPASVDRASALAEQAARTQYVAVPLLTAAEWAAVRAPCVR